MKEHLYLIINHRGAILMNHTWCHFIEAHAAISLYHRMPFHCITRCHFIVSQGAISLYHRVPEMAPCDTMKWHLVIQ